MKRLVNTASLPVYLLTCCLALPLYTRLSLDEAAPPDERPKRLVLVLDGVPYETIEELRAECCFRDFHAPARMVATFPSLTNPSMIEILGAEDSPGYEDHYYDRQQNRLIGGFQDRIRGGKFIKGTFREQFDYHAPALRGSLAYLGQPLGALMVAQSDIAAFRRAFRRSRAPVFTGYIGATDSLAHLGGREPLKAVLRTLDRIIGQLRAEQNGELAVEILSDHGNRYGVHRHAPLNAALDAAGFAVEKSLAHKRSVILPRYGLVGSAALFTHPELRAELAAVCAKTEGVDLAVYHRPGEEGRAVSVESRRGRARIVRSGDRYRYDAESGDPLELSTIVSEMRERGLMNAEGFAASEAWWESTRGHIYPDPLRRLFDGLNEHTQTLGDVLLSFEDGYLVGSPFFSAFAEMRATHGNLRRGETDGFAISTRRELGSSVRGSDLHRSFGLDHIKRADVYMSREGHCAAVVRASSVKTANHD
ncbi:MAG: hypothetical protein KF868_16775 [Acidobacteria bacterium]|nr:hypothetical protein [Acidobacteriota bacterium]